MSTKFQDLEREVAGLKQQISRIGGQSDSAGQSQENPIKEQTHMARKERGSQIHTGGTARPVPAGGDEGEVGKHEPSTGVQRVNTVPGNAGEYDENFGHRIEKSRE